jgi:hypothetical protein
LRGPRPGATDRLLRPDRDQRPMTGRNKRALMLKRFAAAHVHR